MSELGPGVSRPPSAAGRFNPFDINPIVFIALMPLAAYLGVRELWGTQPGIAAGCVASLFVFRYTRGGSVIGWLAILGVIIVSASSVAGLVLNSDKAYLANDPVGDYIGAAVFLGSVLIGRPIIGVIVCELYPRLRGMLDPKDRIFVWLTLLYVVENIALGSVRVLFLEQFEVTDYVLWSRVVSWPVRLIVLGVTYLAVDAAIQRRTLETRLARLEAAALRDPHLTLEGAGDVPSEEVR